MRLTNYERDAVRHRIVADIPLVDYDEQMQARINEICLGLLPPDIRKIWDRPALRGYLNCGSYYYCCNSFATPGFGQHDETVAAAIKSDGALAALHDLLDAQRKAVEGVREKLRTNLALCSTDKQFRELFPELAKYLPAQTTVASLPVTTDLVDSLRAVGVPLEAEAA